MLNIFDCTFTVSLIYGIIWLYVQVKCIPYRPNGSETTFPPTAISFLFGNLMIPTIVANVRQSMTAVYIVTSYYV